MHACGRRRSDEGTCSSSASPTPNNKKEGYTSPAILSPFVVVVLVVSFFTRFSYTSSLCNHEEALLFIILRLPLLHPIQPRATYGVPRQQGSEPKECGIGTESREHQRAKNGKVEEEEEEEMMMMMMMMRRMRE